MVIKNTLAVKQMDYEKANERVKEANERADRIEAYIKTQSDTLVDLEDKATKLERKARLRRWFMIWQEVPVAMRT